MNKCYYHNESFVSKYQFVMKYSRIIISGYHSIYKYQIFIFKIQREKPTESIFNESNMLFFSFSSLIMVGCILVWLRCYNPNTFQANMSLIHIDIYINVFI